jgi:hypothetical protein
MIMDSASRQVILLLGMHRSGTSLLAGVIKLLGVHVGAEKDLVPADAKLNPHGYWERTDVVALHEGFLRAHGFGWQRLAGFDWGRISPQSARLLGEKVRELLGAIGHPEQALLIKDPRVCLMLPAWQSAVPAPLNVFAVRDPRDVAASMMSAFPGNFTTHFLLALWQKYVQSALAHVRGRDVLFVSYRALLEQRSVAVQRVSAGLRALGASGIVPADAARLDALLDAGLNHGGVAGGDLSPDQASLHAWLEEECLAAGPVVVADPPLSDKPDSVLRELELVREHCTRQGFITGRKRDSAVVPGHEGNTPAA